MKLMPPSPTGSPDCSSLSESPGRRRSPAGGLREWLVLLSWLILTMLGGRGVFAVPAGPRPRWVNPCDLPGHVFDPSTDMEGAPPIESAEIFRNVRERSFVAKKHAEEVTKKFVKTYFHDPMFIQGTSTYRQEWLPKIPPPSLEAFRETTDQEALLKSFEFLQFFAVGFEQIILDQAIHGGHFLGAFRDLENDLTQVLCELQLGLFSLRVPPSADVLRDAMSQEYRDYDTATGRNIRDYLILRDFVVAADYVEQLFGYLERTL